MHKLKFADASFLYAETTRAAMNIASVQLLEIPPQLKAGYFQKLVDHLEENVEKIGFMTRKLVDAPFSMDQPIWVTDTHFQIENHVHRAMLPAPGTFKQLERMVSQLHEQPLDRKKPLCSST